LSAEHGAHEKLIGRFIIKLLKCTNVAVSISKETGHRGDNAGASLTGSGKNKAFIVLSNHFTGLGIFGNCHSKSEHPIATDKLDRTSHVVHHGQTHQTGQFKKPVISNINRNILYRLIICGLLQMSGHTAMAQ
jgi:hypothetical protein